MTASRCRSCGGVGETDEGTVLLLILGLVVVVAMLVVVVTDASALYLERRKLVAAADGAALAGAQEVDEADIYQNGLPPSGPVPLDATAAEQAATAYLTSLGIEGEDVRVDVTPTTVSVQIRSRYRLPISSSITMGAAGDPVVSASATARTAVIP